MSQILHFTPTQHTKNLLPTVKVAKASQNVPIIKLPEEILLLIFAILKKTDLVNCSEVCRHFYHISNLPSIWQTCFRHTFPKGQIPHVDLHPKVLFQEYDLFRKNAINGLITCHVLKAPEQINWVGLLENGTKAIGENLRKIYIFDLQKNTTTEFIPENAHDLFQLREKKQIFENKLMLSFSTLKGPNAVFVLNLTSGKMTLLSDSCHQIFYLREDKIGITVSSGKQDVLEIYDLRSETIKPTEVSWGKKIDGVIELENGKIVFLSCSPLSLEVWDTNDQIWLGNAIPISRFTYFTQTDDGSVVTWNSISHKGCFYDPKTHAIKTFENIKQENPLLYQTTRLSPCIASTDYSGSISVFFEKSVFSCQNTFMIEFKDGGEKSYIKLLNPFQGADPVIDHSFSSPSTLVLLSKKTIQRLNFGDVDELLMLISEEFIKTLYAQPILSVLSTNLRKNIMKLAKPFDLQKELMALNPDHLKQHSFAQLDFAYQQSLYGSLSLIVKRKILECKIINLSDMDVEDFSETTISPLHFFDKDVVYFTESAQTLHKMERISIGYVQKFKLLPQKVRDAIYNELEKIIAPKVGHIYPNLGVDAFHQQNGQAASAEECSRAILNYLVKQGHNIEELSMLPNETYTVF